MHTKCYFKENGKLVKWIFEGVHASHEDAKSTVAANNKKPDGAILLVYA